MNAISGLDCWLNYWTDLSFILYTTNPGHSLEFKLVEHRDICTLVTFTVSLVQYSHCALSAGSNKLLHKGQIFPRVTQRKELCKPYLELLMGNYAKHATSHSWGGISMQVLICIKPSYYMTGRLFQGKDLCKHKRSRYLAISLQLTMNFLCHCGR